jgi:hypothetical protein
MPPINQKAGINFDKTFYKTSFLSEDGVAPMLVDLSPSSQAPFFQFPQMK